MISERYPETVLVTGARAPAALSAARLFHDAGLRVLAADCCPEPLTRADRRVYDTLHHPPPNADPNGFRAALVDFIERYSVDMIFPTCEEIFHIDRALSGTKSHGKLYAPASDLLFRAHSKASFPEMLRDAGLAAPKTRRLERLEDLPDGEVLACSVLKPEYSRFATQALISPSYGKAARAMRDQPASWIIQERLQGPEICVYAMAREGRVTACWSYRPRYRAGQGASIWFQPERSARVDAYVKKFVEQTGWTGQIGMDLIDDPDRGLVAIEANPRATSGIHGFASGRDLMRAMDGSCCDLMKPDDTPRAIRSALAVLGWAQALRRGEFGIWVQDMRRARDAVDVDGFSSAGWQMLRTSFAFYVDAWRLGCSAIDATTSDISWDK